MRDSRYRDSHYTLSAKRNYLIRTPHQYNICYAFRVFVRDCKADYIYINASIMLHEKGGQFSLQNAWFFVSRWNNFYFFWRVVLNLPQIMKVNLLVRVKCVFRTHVRQFCIQAINFQWKYTYFYFLTLSLSSWNCPNTVQRLLTHIFEPLSVARHSFSWLNGAKENVQASIWQQDYWNSGSLDGDSGIPQHSPNDVTIPHTC